MPPAVDLQGIVSAFVVAAITIAATLLGLYYATIGVIASTIYRSVSGDVRDLFIRERSSETYLKIVILTIAGGITILVAGTLGHNVAGLTLVVLGLFAAFTCIGLVGVTKRLFDYFDPSKLSAPLLKQIGVGIQLATNGKTRALPRRQSEARYETHRALASFRNLVDMVSDKELRNAQGPVALTQQLLAIVRAYSSQKHKIPTDSNWWDRVPKHQNWLTIDQTRLQMALNTSVGSPPELQPDYLWLENKIARLLSKSLTIAFQSQGGANALNMSEAAANVLADLTARLQIDEALAIEAAWDKVVLEVTTTSKVAAVDADDYEVRLNQMAAAESLVLPLTQMVLGLASAANRIIKRDLSAEFDAALLDPDERYRGHLPTATRQMLETFSLAIRREHKIEGRRTTPRWWIDHLAARSMAEALLATEDGVLGEVQRRTIGQVTHFQEADRPDLAAVTGMASLELLHKIEFHEPSIRKAEEKLASFRNLNTSIGNWPERQQLTISPTEEHTAMLGKLSELLPALRTTKFDPREPDLYGQLYQFVVDGAFRSIIAGDHTRGLAMYSAALQEMEPARLRIAADLERQEQRVRTIYAVEPIITAMDLAGYAMLMYELDDNGIWPQIKLLWDDMLTNYSEIAEFLLAAAEFVDGTFALTVGGIERSRRSIEMGRVFEERNIGQDETHSWDFDNAEKLPHPSPIVSALAPRGYGIQDDLYVLFIVEYLKDYLPEDAALGHKAKMLANQVARYRENENHESKSAGGEG
ncbi:hypothetical protein [Arthrobacter sp. STN4]|uniref:hypothetical protein n=1 Tax=Arthrobacter sp. STN4 TaxID=2923276 RepID=UPI00211A6FEE|nr:hypothetical protein [Arthrobacter sp. STN4]MCQ9164128.1 hypothetical protein [Arthrobacter sp. STN4]